VPVVYCVEPERNIALARNRSVAAARGDFIAFIDDDECPPPDWLARLFECCETFQASGVLGPVRPRFETPPPAWVVRGRFCERPEHHTGEVLEWEESRTGNVLVRRAALPVEGPPFDKAFGTGGEDKDFFWRMKQRGHVFRWCNEAPVYETVPAWRLRAGYMFRRAFLRGRNIVKHSEGRGVAVLKSLAALPFYTLLVPFAALTGRHRGVAVAIRWCDHCGRLLALLGLNRIHEREM
jgi:glycosyltransferase involved in cell wall biosynthesis